MNKKPFVFGVATSGDNFTDRKKETARLISNFTHGVNTILISPRRWGKTSLVLKAGKLAQKEKIRIVHLDIFACRTENDFYTAFANAVLKQTYSKMEEIVEYTRTFLSRINPKISFGAEQEFEFNFSFDVKSSDNDFIEILNLPEKIANKKGISIVICIDEFQQISEFKDSRNFQKRLRSEWQLQKSVSYCLYGSKKHLMHELFDKKNLPFYKFGDSIYLQKISNEDWIPYICERFDSTGKEISKELAKKICQLVDNHSSYVQQLAWLLWIQTEQAASDQNLTDAFNDLIDQNAAVISNFESPNFGK